jgi:catechol 2,3-dioxygenase
MIPGGNTLDDITKPCIGHTHFTVADLDRAIAFWRDVIGMDLMLRHVGQFAAMSWGGYHHPIALNTWHSAGGTPHAKHHTGLFHVALLYPTRHALVVAAKRVADAGVDIYGQADHGVSAALFFDDPDGNGIEIYWDKPRAEWPLQDDGSFKFANDRFELGPFLAETT